MVRAEASESAETPVAIAPAPIEFAPAEAALDAAAPSDVPAFARPLEDAWVELPAVEDKPTRARGRGRGRGAARSEQVADIVAEPVADAPPTSEDGPPPVANGPITVDADAEVLTSDLVETDVMETEALVHDPAPEPATKPALAAPLASKAPEPVMAEPDPAEISQPPTAPKRGWWRRGA